jgi:DNA-binding response OmpR family regulator
MKHKPRILLVEDDQMSRDMLIRRLTSRGFRVAAVSDGPDCLRYIQGEIPDLILLDVQIPGMSGLEVVSQIRQKYSHDVLPVILVTALGESEDIVRGLEAGANDYVVKPVNLPVLLARMTVSLKTKFGISLLMEAERQRVIVEALKQACHQLSQPMTAVMMTLEDLVRHPPSDPQDMRQQLTDVMRWAQEVGDVIHRLQRVGTPRPVPYVQRLEMFDAGPEGTGTSLDRIVGESVWRVEKD